MGSPIHIGKLDDIATRPANGTPTLDNNAATKATPDIVATIIATAKGATSIIAGSGTFGGGV